MTRGSRQFVERGGDIELLGEIYLDREYVYGPDYVDEFIAQFDRDGHAIFMLQGGNYNVVALVSGPGHPGGDDGQGNPQPLPSGTVLEQYTYEPYGALVAAEMFFPHAMNRAGHQGLFFERFDGSYDDYTLFRVAQGTAFITGAKGLYYNRNRFYSPTLGRFTTRDPNETALPIVTALAMNGQALRSMPSNIGTTGMYIDGMNLYGYQKCYPINTNDPTGCFGILDMAGASAIVNDANSQYADMGIGLLGAIEGIIGFMNWRNGIVADAIGHDSFGDTSDIDSITRAYDVVITTQMTLISGGLLTAGVRMAAAGFGRYVAKGIRRATSGAFRLLAADIRSIARGHAWTKHADHWAEMGLMQPQHLEDILYNTTRGPPKVLERGRMAWWDDRNRLVVIFDPNHVDRGTAFLPKNGKAFFDNLK